MVLRKSWPSTLFLYEEQGFRRVERTKQTGLHVGIWWQSEERLVAFVQPITGINSKGGFIDSDLSHDAVWDTASQVLSCSSQIEYFEIPRGRILWDTGRRHAIIYHGKATPGTVFSKLAKLFRLPQREARLDVHYLTGDALEAFYNLD